MLLRIIELAIVFLMVAFVATQIGIPIMCGTLWFPSFRWKAKALERLRAEARESVEEAEIASETEAIKEEAERKRPKKKEVVAPAPAEEPPAPRRRKKF